MHEIMNTEKLSYHNKEIGHDVYLPIIVNYKT